MQLGQQLRVGLLNDLHYDGGVEAMNRLYESVAQLNLGNVDLLVVLGDLVDGDSKPQARRLLREVSALCDSFHGPVHYMPGNHDLDHLSKAEFYHALGQPDAVPACRFQHGGFEFICIDGNFSPDGTEYNNGNFRWQEAFVPETQLSWLDGQLGVAQGPVVVFSHQRVDLESEFAVRNHAAVREVLRNAGKVKAVFQGHQHADDLRVTYGTTYYTLSAHVDGAGPALLESGEKGTRLIRDFRALELV